MLIESDWLNVLLDTGEDKGHLIQVHQVWFGNPIPGHLGIFLIDGYSFFSIGQQPPSGPGPPRYRRFTITLRHSTLSRTPLGEWPARLRDRYLTTHNAHKRQTSVPLAWFEPTIPASERP
jgi:hypothetical protein